MSTHLCKGLLQSSSGLREIPEVIQEIALVLVLRLEFVDLLRVAVLQALEVAALKAAQEIGKITNTILHKRRRLAFLAAAASAAALFLKLIPREPRFTLFQFSIADNVDLSNLNPLTHSVSLSPLSSRQKTMLMATWKEGTSC